MFYDRLMKLCKERNVKPTPLIKSLGLSTGNLKRWQEGSSVNSEIVMKFADYFNVSANYFYVDGAGDDEDIDLDAYINEKPMTKAYHIIDSNPDHIVSLMSGKMPSAADLVRIADYLNYAPEYFLRDTAMHEKVKDVNAENTLLGAIPPKDLVINVLNKLSHSSDFNFLQVRISKIVLSNLARRNIQREQLRAVSLYQKKLDDLYNSSLFEDDVTGLNFSDLQRLSEALNLSYDYLLTGREAV